MLLPHRCFLLLLGDDGAVLLPPPSRLSEPALFAPSHHDEACQPLLDLITRHPKIPVLIVADTLTQSYKSEELPDLSYFDKRKLLDKRLAQAFPKSMLTAKVSTGPRQALLLALDPKGCIEHWLTRLADLCVQAGPCCLLPLECADMIAALHPKQSQDDWVLFLAQHKSGGMRQIVTHNGSFVFTRLTSPLSETTNLGFQAASFVQDIKATRDYLSRFGLKNDTPLHMVAILPQALHDAFSKAPFAVSSRRLLTPHEAATELKLPFTPTLNGAFADLISLLWLSRKWKLRAPLMTKSVRSRLRHATLRTLGISAALLTFACLLIGATYQTVHLLNIRNRVEQQRERLHAIQNHWHETQRTLAPQTEPLGQLRLAAERQRLFANQANPVRRFYPLLARTLGDAIRATRLQWDGRSLTLDLQLTPEDNQTPESQRATFDHLHETLSKEMPTATITLTPQAPSSFVQEAITSDDTHRTTPLATATLLITFGAP